MEGQTDVLCFRCRRGIPVGSDAYVSDWKVIDTSGETVTFKNETRFEHVECVDSDD